MRVTVLHTWYFPDRAVTERLAVHRDLEGVTDRGERAGVGSSFSIPEPSITT